MQGWKDVPITPGYDTPGSLLHVVPTGPAFPAAYAGLLPAPFPRNGDPSAAASSSRPRLTAAVLLCHPVRRRHTRINRRHCKNHTSACPPFPQTEMFGASCSPHFARVNFFGPLALTLDLRASAVAACWVSWAAGGAETKQLWMKGVKDKLDEAGAYPVCGK